MSVAKLEKVNERLYKEGSVEWRKRLELLSVTLRNVRVSRALSIGRLETSSSRLWKDTADADAQRGGENGGEGATTSAGDEADLDWISEQIVVSRPKQRRTQCYPLLPSVGEAILRYLRDVRPRCEHRALFLTLGAPIRPLSATSITPIARARLTTLGVTLSPRGAHCLRHACASHLLASGFTLKQIGDHLGHRSANSTLSYTKVDLQGLRQVAELDLGRLL